MERLIQGPINSSEQLSVGCLEASGFVSINHINNTESLKLEEEEEPNYCSSAASLDDFNMPFLQMLQSPPLLTFADPNFQTLLRFQHLNKKPWEDNGTFVVTEVAEMGETQIQGLELESCVTHDFTVKSNPNQTQTQKLSNSKPFGPAATTTRERRKRKRQRPSKNKEEAESQRMTHIAVERNRRRQMNDHLNALRSLMPASYVQRGHQASIVGGAIDFVRELEQLLSSLEARKRMRLAEDGGEIPDSGGTGITSNTLYASPPPAKYGDGSAGERAESKSEAAEVEVRVAEEEVKMKVKCRRRRGEVARVIVGVEEEMRLTVMHLNISPTSQEDTVLYSFTLKMENDCVLESAEQIAAAMQQIFINGS